MNTVAFVTQKGGCGKSTLAACLAVAAHETGERVFIIDLDPLKSLVSWSKSRDAEDIPVVHVTLDKLARTLKELQALGVTLAILDAPGGDSAALAAAIKSATLCVIPVRPNAFDLEASAKTRDVVKAHKREFAFALNQCPPAQQNARIEHGVEALDSMGALLAPLLTTRVDYQEAARWGLGVTEINPSGAAAEEMRKLWGSTRRRLKKIAGTVKKAA